MPGKLFYAEIPSLVIASSGTESNVLTAHDHFGDADGLMIYGAAAYTGTVTVYVAPKSTGTFIKLQSGGADVTITALEATPITEVSFGALKLISSGAEGAERTTPVSKQIRV